MNDRWVCASCRAFNNGGSTCNHCGAPRSYKLTFGGGHEEQDSGEENRCRICDKPIDDGMILCDDCFEGRTSYE